MRVLALCACALFVAGCGLLSGTEATATPTRAMVAVVPTFTSTPEGAMAAQTSGGGGTTQQAAPAAQQQQAPAATDTPAPTDTPVPTVAQFDISGRNQEYTWFQFCCVAGQTGWIFSNLVNVENAHLITVAQNIPPTPVPPTATPVPPTPVPAPVHVDHCAGIGGDGCKFRLRDVDPADNGGHELKLQIGFVHGGRGDEVQKYGSYYVELQKDGVQVHGVDHNTRAGTSTWGGPKGNKYHYGKSIPASQLPGGNVAGTYTIWVMDGNRERDSQNQTFTLHGNQGLVWLIFDQN